MVIGTIREVKVGIFLRNYDVDVIVDMLIVDYMTYKPSTIDLCRIAMSLCMIGS